MHQMRILAQAQILKIRNNIKHIEELKKTVKNWTQIAEGSEPCMKGTVLNFKGNFYIREMGIHGYH
jgi:hypothetical protein